MKDASKQDGHATLENSSTPPIEKAPEVSVSDPEHLEVVRTVSQVPNPRYYEKDGLRTYGDGEDHDHEPPVSQSLCCIELLQY